MIGPTVGLILALGAAMYLLRSGGLVLASFWATPAPLTRALRFVPLSVFAALLIPALPGQEGEWMVRLVAGGCAGLVIWRTRRVAAGMLVGLITFWLLRGYWTLT